MLKIGISASFFYPDVSRAVFGPKMLTYVENDMLRYICHEGVLPVIIPDLEDKLLLPILVELDGFIFTGGTDLAPGNYGEEPIMDGKWKGDAYRDQYELRILDHAIKHDKPIMGICRGIQLMNVYFGGTLYQDIELQKEGSLKHRDALIYDRLNHRLQFTKDSFLSELYDDIQDPVVNTVHHQGIKEVAPDMEVLAICPDDGMVEALNYAKSEPGKVFAVQWHPEFSHTLKDAVLDADRLISYFLNNVKRYSTQ